MEDVEVVFASLAPVSGAYWRSERLLLLDEKLTNREQLDVLLHLLTQAAELPDEEQPTGLLYYLPRGA